MFVVLAEGIILIEIQCVDRLLPWLKLEIQIKIKAFTINVHNCLLCFLK